MARRQRERQRQQKRREKEAKRRERQELKRAQKENMTEEDKGPEIDWSAMVRHTPLVEDEDEGKEETQEEG